ncbi:siderophore-interacting protein [Flavobacterium sp. CS20]|nr:siderophore-interacting protein [Flavobacterium sp. CS20]
MLRIDFEISQSNSAIVFKPGCYVKLHLLVTNRKKPKVRTYTLKNYDEVNKILTIDFALHQPAGIATNWAMCAWAIELNALFLFGAVGLIFTGAGKYSIDYRLGKKTA